MNQDRIHEKNTTREQFATSPRGVARPSSEDSLGNFGVVNSPPEPNSPKRFSNIKNRLIGLTGAILIGLMVYNLLVNYLGLV